MGRKSKRLHVPANAVEKESNLSGKRYKAGIYARLSVNKEEKNESIDVQVEIAKKFVEDWNKSHADIIEVMDCYKDLGKTGSNFERDEFKRLMQDVRLGDIDCVIVKDLSRFGRNYLEAGNYIEKIFPFLGVRFIAVADGYDTETEDNHTTHMATEIKNLINDMYAKDFSTKARLSLEQRRQEGSYVGGPPPYGYKAVWEGKLRRLVPDENTAGIIRQIYRKFLETESYKAVADDLNKSRVNPPSVYHKSGVIYSPPDIPYKGWDKGYIEVLLKNEAYIGRLVQGKTSISPGKVRKWTQEDTWKINEQAHEPLVEKEVFEQAGEVCRRIHREQQNRKHSAKEYPIEENIFENVIFCGVCGRKMTRHSHVRSYADGSRKRVDEYFCINAVNTKTDSCPDSNFITKKHLENLLFSLLEVEFAVVLKKQKEYEAKGKDIWAAKRKEFELALCRIREEMRKSDRQDSAAYMEYRMGKLSWQEWMGKKQLKEAEQQEFQAQEIKLQETIRKLEKSEKIFLSAVRALVRLKDGRVFTKELVTALIDKIYVYPEKRVEVVFTFEDVFQKARAAE